jgi:hypothetical protein
MDIWKMKTYEEMIQFTVDQMSDRLRYNAWCAYILLAEAYGKTQEEVAKDINAEVSWSEHLRRTQKKAEQRASNEERRLANLAKKDIS